MIRLRIKVVPGARQSRVVGMLGDAIKLQVAAAPEKGKANHAVVELIAGFFGLSQQQVWVTAGHTQPRKTVVIDGIDAAAVRQRLASLR